VLAPQLRKEELRSSRFVRAAGFQIHYFTNVCFVEPALMQAWNCFPIVLVHGLNLGGSYLLPLAQALTPFAPVFVPDLPGFGRSSRGWPPLSLCGLALVLHEFLTALGITKAHFVGNSFGCQIIVELAIRFPETVDRAVLQSPIMEPGARNPVVAGFRCLRNSMMEPASLGRLTLRDNFTTGPFRATYTLFEALRDRLEEKLPKIDAPTMVLWGDRDVIVRRNWAERVTRLLRRGTLRILPGVTHTANFVAPQEFCAAIVPFLQAGRCGL
jgi:pimeloyl-ACP methyl ester carboxylesterase